MLQQAIALSLKQGELAELKNQSEKFEPEEKEIEPKEELDSDDTEKPGEALRQDQKTFLLFFASFPFVAPSS